MLSVASAVRALARRRRASAAAIAVLALGIGLVAAMASVLRGVWLRGLPFAGGDRIVAFSTGPAAAYPMSPMDFRALRTSIDVDPSATFDEVAAFRTFNTVVTDVDGGSRGTTGTYVTPNLFAILGVEPVLGRGFVADDAEPGAPRVAILSYSAWQEQFAGDPAVLGRSIVVNRQASTVVGVMPRGFNFPVRQEVWGVLLFEGEPWSRSGLFALGKLRPGVSPEAATQELRARVARLDADDPLPRPREANLRRYVDAVLDARLKQSLLVMMAAVVGVLIAACINVANLRFADALSRRDELAVRGALGASRGRLFGLILGESFLAAAAGTVAGLGLAWALTSIVGRRLVEGGPLRSSFWVDVRLDPMVFAIAATAGVLAALAGGLLPAVWSSRNDRLLPSREPESRPASTATKLIVGGQVAASLVLLLYTGLFSRTALDLLRPELGFDRRGLASAILSTYQAEHDTPEARHAFVERLFVELEAQPEIEAAALASFWPWKTGSARVAVFAEASVGGQPLTTAARHLGVTPGFFVTLGLPLLEGRSLTAGDSAAASGEFQGVAGAAPAVVSRSFARRHLGDEALGKVIELEAPSARAGSFGALQVDKRRAEVVGVVEDLGLEIANALQSTTSSVSAEAEEAIYQAFPVEGRDGGFLLVRGRAASAPPARAIDEAIARADPRAVALDHETFEETLAVATWTERRLAQLFALFGAATLLLTAAGVYAVVSLIVTRRSREYAIRVALGARPGDVGALVLRSVVASVLIGMALAATVVVLTARWVEPFLRGTSVAEPILAVSTLLVVIAVAAVAVVGPARRAAAVDPQSALRST